MLGNSKRKGTHKHFINFGLHVILKINSKEPEVFVFGFVIVVNKSHTFHW